MMRLSKFSNFAGPVVAVSSIVAGWVLTGCGSEGGVGVITESLVESAPVINGTATSSWKAVGALVVNSYGLQSFCSGTLVADRWVLTAAHCADERETQIPITYVSFFVGADVGASGSKYSVSSATIHPDWDPQNIVNDLSLLHLSSAVPGSVATPMPINTTAVTVGESITFVGYGVNVSDGQGSGDGGGVKRYGRSTIDQVNRTDFQYSPGANRVMICSGDSGGPDFVGATGSEKVGGIHSTADQYCEYGGSSTRVDAFKAWIYGIIGSPATGCDMTGGTCGAKACSLGTAGGANTCVTSSNLGVGHVCDPSAVTASNVPCVDGAACTSYADGPICYQICYAAGDCQAGDGCVLVLPGATDLGICVAPCVLTGGNCGSGYACYPEASGVDVCQITSGTSLGVSCDPNPSGSSAPLSCADGLICVSTSSSNQHAGICKQFCLRTSDCGDGEDCAALPLQSVSALSVCSASGSGCTSGSVRCALGVAQRCNAGVWVTSEDCPAEGKVCGTSDGTPVCIVPACACNSDATCDSTCACDPDCPCSCDATWGCDDSCTCDPDCKDDTSGCSAAGAETALPASATLLFLVVGWRRRRFS